MTDKLDAVLAALPRFVRDGFEEGKLHTQPVQIVPSPQDVDEWVDLLIEEARDAVRKVIEKRLSAKHADAVIDALWNQLQWLEDRWWTDEELYEGAVEILDDMEMAQAEFEAGIDPRAEYYVDHATQTGMYDR